MKKHINNYFKELNKINKLIDQNQILKLVKLLVKIRKDRGRIFFLGVGGSAANCSHAVNDFRKLCNIESYCPTDNVSELTARINDESWEKSLSEWLKISKLRKKDCLFIMSVGGGNLEKNVSINLINAIDYGLKKQCNILGIAGRDGGYVSKKSKFVCVIPNTNLNLTTPLTESYQAVVWHCIVSHPLMQVNATKW